MLKKIVVLIVLGIMAGCAGTNFDWKVVNELKQGTSCADNCLLQLDKSVSVNPE